MMVMAAEEADFQLTGLVFYVYDWVRVALRVEI